TGFSSGGRRGPVAELDAPSTLSEERRRRGRSKKYQACGTSLFVDDLSSLYTYPRGNSMRIPVAVAALTAMAFAGFAQQSGPYKMLKTAKIGGTGSFGYL